MTDHNEAYVNNLIASFRQNGMARQAYFPMDKAKRRRMNLRLGREVGYGLTEGADLGSLYSRLIVIHSLDSTGVCVDNKEFLAAVREGMAKAKGEA